MKIQQYVRTIIHCRRCGADTTWCVRVDRGVPDQLRCTPSGVGGGASGTGLVCPRCSNSCGMSITDLERRVADALHGHGVDEWIKRGAVVIDC